MQRYGCNITVKRDIKCKHGVEVLADDGDIAMRCASRTGYSPYSGNGE